MTATPAPIPGVILPALPPTDIRFSEVEWPQSVTRSRNGRTVRRILAGGPSGGSLELVWENLRDVEAEILLQAWDQVYGTYGITGLPDAALAGMEESLRGYVRQPHPLLTWRFAEPPAMERVKPGRCTVRMRLTAKVAISFDIGGGEVVAPPEPPVEIVSNPMLISTYESVQGSGLNVIQHAGACMGILDNGDSIWIYREMIGRADRFGNWIWLKRNEGADPVPFSSVPKGSIDESNGFIYILSSYINNIYPTLVYMVLDLSTGQIVSTTGLESQPPNAGIGREGYYAKYLPSFNKVIAKSNIGVNGNLVFCVFNATTHVYENIYLAKDVSGSRVQFHCFEEYDEDTIVAIGGVDSPTTELWVCFFDSNLSFVKGVFRYRADVSESANVHLVGQHVYVDEFKGLHITSYYSGPSVFGAEPPCYTRLTSFASGCNVVKVLTLPSPPYPSGAGTRAYHCFVYRYDQDNLLFITDRATAWFMNINTYEITKATSLGRNVGGGYLSVATDYGFSSATVFNANNRLAGWTHRIENPSNQGGYALEFLVSPVDTGSRHLVFGPDGANNNRQRFTELLTFVGDELRQPIERELHIKLDVDIFYFDTNLSSPIVVSATVVQSDYNDAQWFGATPAIQDPVPDPRNFTLAVNTDGSVLTSANWVNLGSGLYNLVSASLTSDGLTLWSWARTANIRYIGLLDATGSWLWLRRLTPDQATAEDTRPGLPSAIDATGERAWCAHIERQGGGTVDIVMRRLNYSDGAVEATRKIDELATGNNNRWGREPIYLAVQNTLYCTRALENNRNPSDTSLPLVYALDPETLESRGALLFTNPDVGNLPAVLDVLPLSDTRVGLVSMTDTNCYLTVASPDLSVLEQTKRYTIAAGTNHSRYIGGKVAEDGQIILAFRGHSANAGSNAQNVHVIRLNGLTAPAALLEVNAAIEYPVESVASSCAGIGIGPDDLVHVIERRGVFTLDIENAAGLYQSRQADGDTALVNMAHRNSIDGEGLRAACATYSTSTGNDARFFASVPLDNGSEYKFVNAAPEYVNIKAYTQYSTDQDLSGFPVVSAIAAPVTADIPVAPYTAHAPVNAAYASQYDLTNAFDPAAWTTVERTLDP